MSSESRIGETVAFLRATANNMTEAVGELKAEIREHSKQSTELVIAVDRLGRDVELVQADLGSAVRSLELVEGRLDKLEDTLDPEDYARARRRSRKDSDEHRSADAKEKTARARLWTAITAAIGGGGLLGYLAKLFTG